MKIEVYDTYLKHADGKIIHFDVLLVDGSDSNEAAQVAVRWLHSIQPGYALDNPFQGLHHVYANARAVEGLKNNQYKDGSILVFDLLSYIEKDKSIQEGPRKLIGVMSRDEKKYSKTGGWGFEGFRADSKTERLVTDGGMSCYECHAPQKSNQFVFSKDRS